MSDIIKSGLQIICSRKNANVEKAEDKVGTPVVDPKQIKFYEKLGEAREEQIKAGKQPTPMFRCELVHWDEDGNPKKTSISYQTLAPDNVTSILNTINLRLGPPGSRKKNQGEAGDAGGDGTGGGDAGGGDEAAKKAAADKAAADKAAADKAEADKKAAADKAAADKKAADKAEADKKAAEKKAAEAKAAETKTEETKPAEAKSAAEKARAAAVAEQAKADEAKAAAEGAKPAADSGDFNDLFDE